jgi:TPR repeat protein
MRQLGATYAEGIGGVTPDRLKAREWFTKAANAGDATARNWLNEHGY